MRDGVGYVMCGVIFEEVDCLPGLRCIVPLMFTFGDVAVGLARQFLRSGSMVAGGGVGWARGVRWRWWWLTWGM